MNSNLPEGIKFEFGNEDHIKLSKRLPILNYESPVDHDCDCEHCDYDGVNCASCGEELESGLHQDGCYYCSNCERNYADYWQKSSVVDLFNKTFGTSYKISEIKEMLFKDEENENN